MLANPLVFPAGKTECRLSLISVSKSGTGIKVSTYFPVPGFMATSSHPGMVAMADGQKLLIRKVGPMAAADKATITITTPDGKGGTAVVPLTNSDDKPMEFMATADAAQDGAITGIRVNDGFAPIFN